VPEFKEPRAFGGFLIPEAPAGPDAPFAEVMAGHDHDGAALALTAPRGLAVSVAASPIQN